jgi:hypothetical protein
MNKRQRENLLLLKPCTSISKLPEGKLAVAEAMHKYKQTPEGKLAVAEAMHKYEQTPEGKLAVAEAMHKYEQTPEGKLAVAEAMHKYEQTPEGKLAVAEAMHKYEQTPEGKLAVAEAMHKYEQTPEGKLAVAQSIKKKSEIHIKTDRLFNRKIDADARILRKIRLDFDRKIPNLCCLVCKTIKYLSQLQMITGSLIAHIQQKHIEKEVSSNFREWIVLGERICKQCVSEIEKHGVSLLSEQNNVVFQKIPDFLPPLSDLERLLISIFIPFVRFRQHPSSLMCQMSGMCVCVEARVSDTVQKLPRNMNDIGVVDAYLKRRLNYDSVYLHELISVQNIFSWLKYLRKTELYREKQCLIEDQSKWETFNTFCAQSMLNDHKKIVEEEILAEQKKNLPKTPKPHKSVRGGCDIKIKNKSRRAFYWLRQDAGLSLHL